MHRPDTRVDRIDNENISGLYSTAKNLAIRNAVCVTQNYTVCNHVYIYIYHVHIHIPMYIYILYYLDAYNLFTVSKPLFTRCVRVA